MVMTCWSWSASEGNEIGRLLAGQSLPVTLLLLIVQDGIKPFFQIGSAHLDGRIATDMEGIADLGIGPAICCLQQGIGTSKGSSIGFSCMEKGLQRSSICFRQGDSNGMIIHGLLSVFFSVSHSCQSPSGLTTSINKTNGSQKGNPHCRGLPERVM